jgi:hypothetical protein
MDVVLALIVACSLHHDDALVRAFIQKVSDGNAYFVGDLATVTSHDHVQSLPEALALVAEIEKQGGRAAVGLMAVPVEWAARYGRQPADLFDGCINIAIGTDAMDRFAGGCLARTGRRLGHTTGSARPARWRLVASRGCILRRFDVELGVRGYPEGVLSELARLSARPGNRASESHDAHSQVVPTEPAVGSEDDWSDRRLDLAPSQPPSAPRTH